MKRSRSVVLVMSGTLAAGALAGCDQSRNSTATTVEVDDNETYTNNHFVLGAGYYHAPYRGWYPYPYNWHVAGHGYYHGGTWTSEPEQSPVTASRPTAEAARVAGVHGAGRSGSAGRSASVSRGGFGGSAHASGA
jgi:hypothetical protein